MQAQIRLLTSEPFPTHVETWLILTNTNRNVGYDHNTDPYQPSSFHIYQLTDSPSETKMKQATAESDMVCLVPHLLLQINGLRSEILSTFCKSWNL